MKKSLLSLLSLLAAVSCAKEPAPYVSTPEREYLGSIYYAKSNCVSCHGAKWDGKGPEAKSWIDNKLPPTDFTTVNNSELSPADYFKAITDPEKYFEVKKAKAGEDVQVSYSILASQHWPKDYTDKARWAIANFLFSRNPALANNKDAIAKDMAEVKEVYKTHRRWEIGYKPIAEREKSPDLSAMINKGNPADEEYAMTSVTELRIAAADENTAGKHLFENNCAGCHGRYAEGLPATGGKRLGLIGERHAAPAEITRLAPVYVSTRDLALAASMKDQKSFSSAHESGTFTAPSFASYTEEEWKEIYAHVKKLTGK